MVDADFSDHKGVGGTVIFRDCRFSWSPHVSLYFCLPHIISNRAAGKGLFTRLTGIDTPKSGFLRPSFVSTRFNFAPCLGAGAQIRNNAFFKPCDDNRIFIGLAKNIRQILRDQNRADARQSE